MYSNYHQSKTHQRLLGQGKQSGREPGTGWGLNVRTHGQGSLHLVAQNLHKKFRNSVLIQKLKCVTKWTCCVSIDTEKEIPCKQWLHPNSSKFPMKSYYRVVEK